MDSTTIDNIAKEIGLIGVRIAAALLAAMMLASCATPRLEEGSGGQLERLEIVSRGPAWGGTAFDDTGDYEKIVAVAHMRLNPRHPANSVIADLDLAPASGGWVSYQADVIIVRPRDAARSSRVLLLDVPNRGGRLLPVMLNDGSADIDSAAGAGNGFAMRRGHTMVWIGWQGDIGLARDGKLAGIALPQATRGGQPITGPSAQEAVFDNSDSDGHMDLAYPAATLDQAAARLTVRATALAPATLLPASAWRFVNASRIALTRPEGFDGGAIYRFEYTARDPKVMGIGMAALRDVTAWLKTPAAGNPLADLRLDTALAAGVSQSGRFLRDFLWQGFNRVPGGGKVFDGAMPLIAGSRKSFVNLRFSQPGRYSTQHIDHVTYGDQFPFSYAVTTDPVGGKTDGIFARCQASGSCPKLMHVDSSVEFWQGRASLVAANGAGQDIALPPEARAYLLSSTQHVAASKPAMGICRYLNNPAQQGAAVRVLLDHLVAWAREGKEPPASRYPTHAEGMLTAPERDENGFPDLRRIGVQYPTGLNELALVDYEGSVARVDPVRRYQVHVPMVDADGHDIAGIRLPDVAVPLATHTGWNLRRKGFADGQLCGLNGMYVPFAPTARAGDPRRSLAERYGSRMGYAKEVARSARALRDEGLMLQEDVDRYIEQAKAEPRIAP